jgi:integrase
MGNAAPSVDASNARLKGAGIPVRLRVHRQSLYLRCSRLPPKPGDEPSKRYEIPQGPVGAITIRRAEARAYELWAAVVERRFDWGDWDLSLKQGDTVAAWVAKLKAQHLSTGQCTARTWDKHWAGAVFSRMVPTAKLTPALILDAVLKTPENTRQRRLTCQKLAKLAECAGIEVELRRYQGNYGRGKVQPRDLPTDEQIEGWYTAIASAPWRIIFARLVVFGLRPSESFQFELMDNYTARVIDAKSGQLRETKAFHPYWADRWPLSGELPKITWRESHKAKDITERVRTGLKRYGVSCQRYDLRHAWCVRVSVEYKIPTSLAARWAGHSEAVHNEQYLRWIRADQSEAVYRAMVLGEG